MVFSLAIIAFNLVALLAAVRIVKVIEVSGVQVIAKIAGILLALQDRGVLERMSH